MFSIFLEVNLPPLEDYLEPNAGYPQHSAPSRPARVPSVDEDGYLQPNSATGYIDLLSEGKTIACVSVTKPENPAQ